MSYNKETGMYEGYIYRIFNNYNSRSYIGQTSVSIKRRWMNHCSLSSVDCPMQIIHQAMKKHGIDNFNIEMIQKYEAYTKQELSHILDVEEIKYIEIFNSYYKNQNGGYNMTLGGKNTSEYAGKRLGVYCYKANGSFIGFFNSKVDAANVLDITMTSITYSLRRNTINSFGYYFNSKKEFCPNYYYGTKRHIKLYDMDHNEIGTFISISDAMRYIGVGDKAGRSQIYRCLKHEKKHAFGYIWESFVDNDKMPVKGVDVL